MLTDEEKKRNEHKCKSCGKHLDEIKGLKLRIEELEEGLTSQLNVVLSKVKQQEGKTKILKDNMKLME